MAHINAANTDALRATYSKTYNPVSDVAHVFGWASYQNFYFQCEGWANFIDVVFPDYFPFGTVQNVLIEVVKLLHDSQAQGEYNNGVEQGRQLEKKASEVVDWAKGEINAQVEGMKNRIQTEIINPIQQKADSLNAQLKEAQAKLATLNKAITDAQNVLTEHAARIKALEARGKGAFDSLFKLG